MWSSSSSWFLTHAREPRTPCLPNSTMLSESCPRGRIPSLRSLARGGLISVRLCRPGVDVGSLVVLRGDLRRQQLLTWTFETGQIQTRLNAGDKLRLGDRQIVSTKPEPVPSPRKWVPRENPRKATLASPEGPRIAQAQDDRAVRTRSGRGDFVPGDSLIDTRVRDASKTLVSPDSPVAQDECRTRVREPAGL